MTHRHTHVKAAMAAAGVCGQPTKVGMQVTIADNASLPRSRTKDSVVEQLGASLTGCTALAAQVRGSEGSRGGSDRRGRQGHRAAAGPGRRAGHGAGEGPAGRGEPSGHPLTLKSIVTAAGVLKTAQTSPRLACMTKRERASCRALGVSHGSVSPRLAAMCKREVHFSASLGFTNAADTSVLAFPSAPCKAVAR